MTNVPHWILRRFASRSIHILERLELSEPSLALYLKTLGVSAPAYLSAYQAVVAYELARSKKIKGRVEAVKSLVRKLRTWVAVLGKDIGLDSSQFGDRPSVPEEVINDTIELLAVLARHEEEGHEMPFYTEELRTDLTASLEAAQAELSAAGGSHVTLSELRDALKAAAETFQADLVTFRRALRAFFGSSYPDYRRLRMPRNVKDMTEDEADPKDGEAAQPDASSVGNESVEVDDDDGDEEVMAEAS
jgi:hypothetical protein